MTAHIAIIGGGPAGLAAAEAAASDPALRVTVFDAMPSVGRKFLMAGKGGLNLTHSEPSPRFLARYGEREAALAPMIAAFGPAELRAWAEGLGITTFIGTSGRVFPAEMKAAPLLRAWVRRLKQSGVQFRTRHRWQGWRGAALIFATPEGEHVENAAATILACGGASWPSLGSDGAWVAPLENAGLAIAPLRPANCGFEAEWSDHFRERFAGAPVKPVTALIGGKRQQGEFVITATGAEGGLVYAASKALRDEIDTRGSATFVLDLAPHLDGTRVNDAVARPRGKTSLATHLRKSAGIEGVKAGLLREVLGADGFADMAKVAQAIKALPLKLVAPRPLTEAISTAGGVRFADLDERLMLRAKPGVFCAGEMLDWEAPTGGYLLTACFATGRAAGEDAAAWLKRNG